MIEGYALINDAKELKRVLRYFEKDESLKIITVEDPVEYQMEAISQIQVHHKIGMTFAAALRSSDFTRTAW